MAILGERHDGIDAAAFDAHRQRQTGQAWRVIDQDRASRIHRHHNRFSFRSAQRLPANSPAAKDYGGPRRFARGLDDWQGMFNNIYPRHVGDAARSSHR
jgi:hypothetical protein